MDSQLPVVGILVHSRSQYIGGRSIQFKQFAKYTDFDFFLIPIKLITDVLTVWIWSIPVAGDLDPNKNKNMRIMFAILTSTFLLADVGTKIESNGGNEFLVTWFIG